MKLNQVRQKSGSLLLEALLSVVILSVSLTLIIQAMTTSLRSTVYSTDYTKAMILMDNKMSDIMQSGMSSVSSGQYDDFEEPFENFELSLNHSDSTEGDSENLNEVNLRISWNVRNRQKSLLLDTYIWEEDLQ